MAKGVSGTDLFDFMMAHAAPTRATRYQHEAEKLQRMAQTEPNENRRQNLLMLAAQYEQLARKIAPASRH